MMLYNYDNIFACNVIMAYFFRLAKRDFSTIRIAIFRLEIDGQNYIDQVPEAEAAFISLNPNDGAVKAYMGGLNFSKSNFDRVKQSFPQAGSSFKPFIYTSAFSNGYKASDKLMMHQLFLKIQT